MSNVSSSQTKPRLREIPVGVRWIGLDWIGLDWIATPRLDHARLELGPLELGPLDSIAVWGPIQSSSLVKMTWSQFRFKWSSRRHFRVDKTLLAIPEPHLNNQQRPSISTYFIKELNPLRMVVLASNSLDDQFSDCLDFKHDNKLKENSNSNSNAMPQPQPTSNHQY